MPHDKMKGKSHSSRSTHSIQDDGAKGRNPDVGPPMQEGAHHYDKGYVSDEEYFSPRGLYPDDHERGNRTMELRNEIARGDSAKLNRIKRTKIS
jgi:hypothetical protein